jgi:hypothetical protein
MYSPHTLNIIYQYIRNEQNYLVKIHLGQINEIQD